MNPSPPLPRPGFSLACSLSHWAVRHPSVNHSPPYYECMYIVLTSFLTQMDVLHVEDPGAGPWLRRQTPPLHLLLGDSVARECMMRSRLRRDRMLNGAWGGATWRELREKLDGVLVNWEQEAEAEGRRLGSVIIWLTGNDIYSKKSGLRCDGEDNLADIAEDAKYVARRLMRVAERVLVLGPLPRYGAELSGTPWICTAAYQLERRLLHQLPRQVRVVPLGRQLCRKYRGDYAIGVKSADWFARDGVHITPAGFGKLMDAESLPVWLTMDAAILA